MARVTPFTPAVGRIATARRALRSLATGIAISLATASAAEVARAQPTDLAACMARLRRTTAGRRITTETWRRHTATLTSDPRVLAQLDQQPEFKLPVWDYLAVMVDDERLEDGRRLMAGHRATFAAIERRYGVDPHVVAAIWGIESNFGQGMGGFDVLRSLATLSCNGRRQAYFRQEFLAALRIVQKGDIAGDRFRGSWAGAFGQVQFMPGSYEWLAVDFDGDGRRDILHTIPDALASAANYLKRSRWRTGEPWGVEVRLPSTLDASAEGRRIRRPLSAWVARGVTRADGASLTGTLPATATAGLHLPAGPLGPAFLVLDNFTAIYRYNASEAYTLAVAHLADRLRGGGPFVTPWPTDDPGLSRADRRELQRLLAQRGHDIGDPTGVLTARTRTAVKAEQGRLGHAVTGRPGQRLLRELRQPVSP